MAAPIPKTIGSDLYRELENLYFRRVPPSPFELRKIQRDGEKLRSADPSEGFIVLGGLAALQWNIDDAKRCSKNAVQLSNSVETYLNAAMTLRAINLVDDLLIYMRKAFSMAPNDEAAVKTFISDLISAGLLQEASDVYINAKANGVDFSKMPDVAHFALKANEIGIAEERLSFEMRTAHQILTNFKRRVRGDHLEIARDPDGGESLVIGMIVIGTLEEEIELEANLANALAEHEDWDPCTLSVEINCVTEDVCLPA